MNKRYFIFTRQIPSQELLALVLTVLFFVVGCIAGTASAKYIDGLSVVPNYISGVITSLESGSNISSGVMSAFIDIAVYPFIVFIMGFLVFGFVLVPFLAAFRGYVYSFSVALLIRYYGASGIFPALMIFGTKSLILIPCFIFLAVQAFGVSMLLTSTAFSRGSPLTSPYNGAFVIKSLFCFALLALLAFLSYIFADSIFNFALGFLQKT